jgi:hypothetical protein
MPWKLQFAVITVSLKSIWSNFAPARLANDVFAWRAQA